MSLLKVQDACGGYSDRPIFQGVNFSLEAGEILVIIGPNGVGKSTLLNSLVNLLPLQKGQILIDDKPQVSYTQHDLAQKVGYIPQLNTQIYNYLVRDYVVMGRAAKIGYLKKPSKHDYEVADEALAKLQLLDYSQRPYNELSGGEQQRINFARVLAQEAKLIILDEPTSALDLGNQVLVLQVIRQLAQQGHGIVMTTHDPNQALRLQAKVALADKRHQTFKIGSAEELMTSERLSQLYQTPIVVEGLTEYGQAVCFPTTC